MQVLCDFPGEKVITKFIPAPLTGLRNVHFQVDEYGEKKDIDKSCGNVRQFSHDVNSQQMYKTITEWFQVWRPWQRCILLCGLTNRCSTGQLEALATTLEPIFHRDFATTLRQRYPSADFKPTVKTKSQKKKGGVQRRSSKMPSRSSRKSVSCGTASSISSYSPSKTHRPSYEVLPAITLKDESLNRDEEENNIQNARNVDDYAEYMANSVLADALKSFEKDNTHENTSDDVRKSDAKVILTEEKPKCNGELANALGNIVKPVSDALGDPIIKVSKIMPHKEPNPPKGKHKKLSQLQDLSDVTHKLSLSDVDVSQLDSSEKLELLLRDRLSLSSRSPCHHSSHDFNVFLSARKPVKTAAVQHHNSWASHTAPNSILAPALSLDSALHLKHIQDTVPSRGFSTDDNFHNKPSNKPVMARLTSRERTFQQTNTSMSLQRLYKNSKCFANQSQNDGILVKPNKRNHKSTFKNQIHQVWQWINNWEDHENMGMLGEVIKLCGADLLNYTAQCLFQRLQERLDVNWLPDRLLLHIFTNLPQTDIESCSQVCRRWRYLCAIDDLWITKCEQFGVRECIPDLLDIVEEAASGDQEVDWKLAYMEVQRITGEVKEKIIQKQEEIIQPPVTFQATREPPKDVQKEEGSDESISDIESIIITELPLKRGTAASLARESERLKGRYVPDTSENISSLPGWSRKKWSSTSSLPPLHAIRSTENIRALSYTPGGRRLSEVPKHLCRSPNVTPVTHKSMEASERTATQQSAQKLEAKPVMQWIRGGQKSRHSGEMALDIRPELVQAQDLLGKAHGSVQLKWNPKSDDQIDLHKKRDRNQASEKYGGHVPCVQRVRKFQGHMDAVLCIQFDQRRLISASKDRSIRIWDIRSGRSIHKLYGHKGAITCLKFDSDTLYTGSWDTVVMVWDLIKFTRKQVMVGHKGSISCLELNDKYLLSGSHDATVRVWSKLTLCCRTVVRGHRSHILSLVCNNKYMVTGSSDKTLRVTEIETGVCIREITSLPEPANCLVMPGSLIISAHSNGQVCFFNRDTGDAEAAIQAHSKAINALTYYRGRFFTGSEDASIKEWDLLSMMCVRILQGQKTAVQDFKITDTRMVSCTADGLIRVWDFNIQANTNPSEDSIPYEVVNQRSMHV